MAKPDWLETCQRMGREVARDVRKVYASERRDLELGRGYGGDITLEVDQVAEDIITRHLKELEVPIGLISEESGESTIGGKYPEYYVVVDPVDGSFNFKSGIDYFASSIAILNKKHEMILGYLINIPNGNEYYADKSGAYKNGKSIHTSDKTKDFNVLLECNSTADPKDVQFMYTVFPRTAHSRAPGAIALDLCRVADGTFDCLLHAGSSRYLDVAAGMYIVEKAGGIVTDFKGNEKIRKGTDLTATSLLIAANKEMQQWIFRQRE